MSSVISSKPRMGTRLKQAVSSSRNKSSDLISARGNFEVMKKRLKLLVTALKNYHQSIVNMHKCRSEAIRLIGALSASTPLEKYGEQSYLSIHSAVATQNRGFSDRFSRFVVGYALEWEKVITTRITSLIKKTDQLRVELDHYQRKVESMRVTVNVSMAKGKGVNPNTSQKLQRNEDKLVQSKHEYERQVHSLCVLIDEVTLKSWVDLHPLLLKMAQFDMTVTVAESKAFAGLNSVVAELQAFAQQNEISASRLTELETMDPYQLSGVESYVPPEGVSTGIVGSGGLPGLAFQMTSTSTNNNNAQPSMSMTPSPSSNTMDNSNEIDPFVFQLSTPGPSPPYGSNDPSFDSVFGASPQPTVQSITQGTQHISMSNSQGNNLNFGMAPAPGAAPPTPPLLIQSGAPQAGFGNDSLSMAQNNMGNTMNNTGANQRFLMQHGQHEMQMQQQQLLQIQQTSHMPQRSQMAQLQQNNNNQNLTPYNNSNQNNGGTLAGYDLTQLSFSQVNSTSQSSIPGLDDNTNTQLALPSSIPPPTSTNTGFNEKAATNFDNPFDSF